ncbi:helix-turn-helix domain-containing protein [Massilia sp. R2A-15]|uniref:helix-turn-helix domain-containing protein n=1 Tax=Massilia sp. R2A-15 TaxID=3064278 RepID=UPI0028052EFB|nr:helix-turn-helix domain-containing protein [Massilia sp. R2A-15]
MQAISERPRGVVNPASARKTFRLERYTPGVEFAPFLDQYWIVEWDLGAQPAYTQRTLPHPCVNLAFDAGKTAIFGVVTGSFEYTLQASGRVLGLRFRPGAFRAFLGKSVSSITDTTIALAAVFGCADAEAERSVLGAADDAGMIAAAEALLRPSLPAPDPKVDQIAAILKLAEQDRELTRVDDLAARSGMAPRTLQALFSEYVGVSPKWALRRYRLHEAAERLVNDEHVDLAAMAQSLGYFDQAHFTADFQALIGKPPAEYRLAAMRVRPA